MDPETAHSGNRPSTRDPTRVNSIEKDSRAGGPGAGAGESVLNGDRASVWEENVLEADGGDGCTPRQVTFTPLSCALKNGEAASVLYTLPTRYAT